MGVGGGGPGGVWVKRACEAVDGAASGMAGAAGVPASKLVTAAYAPPKDHAW